MIEIRELVLKAEVSKAKQKDRRSNSTSNKPISDEVLQRYLDKLNER